jgi:3-oxoadipate enol-lactonase
MYGETFRHDPNRAALRDMWGQRWAEVDRAALVKTLLGVVIRPDIRAELADVTAPTLIIAGGADVSLPPRFAKEIHALIAGSQYIQLPRVGHSSPVEDPQGVTQAMRKFLAELPATRPLSN